MGAFRETWFLAKCKRIEWLFNVLLLLAAPDSTSWKSNKDAHLNSKTSEAETSCPVALECVKKSEKITFSLTDFAGLNAAAIILTVTSWLAF